jgi:hypothetical protein
MSYADPYLGDRQPYANNYNFGIEQQLTNDLAFQVNYVGSQGHFLPVNNSGARGIWSNQLNPSYYNLGGLLSSTVTPAILAQALAINPNIKLPYPTFSGTLAQPAATPELACSRQRGVVDVHGGTAKRDCCDAR